jgi:hypothetical protein
MGMALLVWILLAVVYDALWLAAPIAFGLRVFMRMDF